jgi:hypothetical protein
MSFNPSISAVSSFANRVAKTYALSTEQAEAIQHDTLVCIVDHAEVYVAGGWIQAIYDWHGKREWHLSDDFIKRYVYDVRVAEIERKIRSGLFYLAGPEETVFELAGGLLIEHDVHDAHPYVLYGPDGGEIDRYREVIDLAESLVDFLMEGEERQQ